MREIRRFAGEEVLSAATTVHFGEATEDGIRALRDHIDRHYASIRSVCDIAQHFFYTREHISRLFRQHFDTSIADYLSRRRIAESRRLILCGMPLTEVAQTVGFGSLSTFIRAFRAETDMTPSEYRKFHRKSKKDETRC